MNFRTRKLVACLGLTAALFTTASVEAILASVKSTGMAATCTSYPLDSMAGAYNPAGITFVPNRIDFEGAWDRTQQHQTIVGNGIPTVNGFYDGSKTKDFYLANFGFTRALPCNLTFGLNVYNRNFVKTSYGRPQLLLGTSRLGLEYVHEVVAPMVALRIAKNHSLGVSLNLNFQRFKVSGVENFNSALFSTNPGFVTNKGYNWSSGVGVTIGWLSRFWCDRIAVGVAYTPHGHMQKFRRYRGFYAQGGTFDLPQHWIAGISWKWIPCSTIAFDVEWDNWKQIKALSNPVAENLVVDKLGSTNGTGFGFHNQIFYRVGIDYKLWDVLTLRAGFRHANCPFKSASTAVNALTCDTVENFLTFGFTWNVNRCNELSMFYAHGFKRTLKGHNSIPAVLFGGEVNLTQRKDILGIAWGINY